jgi:hypothetical protein
MHVGMASDRSAAALSLFRSHMLSLSSPRRDGLRARIFTIGAIVFSRICAAETVLLHPGTSLLSMTCEQEIFVALLQLMSDYSGKLVG